MDLPQADDSRWFHEHVQPHEPALRAYLLARFPTLADQDDLVQESYARLLRARQTGPIRFAKAFLFSTARNAALDLFRRDRIVALEPISDSDDALVIEDRPDAADLYTKQQELEVLMEAVQALPERCRRVIMLRHLDGLSYKEIAAELGISPDTVKEHIGKGIARCADFLAARGLLKSPPTGAPAR